MILPNPENNNSFRVSVAMSFEVTLENPQFLTELINDQLIPYLNFSGSDAEGRGRFHFKFKDMEMQVIEIEEIENVSTTKHNTA